MAIGIRPSHRKSTTPTRHTIYPLTEEQIEALKERIERPEEDKAAAKSGNLLRPLLKRVIAFDEFLGGRPMSQLDRHRLDLAESEAIIRTLGV